MMKVFGGGSRTAATSKMAVNYYHKELHLGCCSSPRLASEFFQKNSEQLFTMNFLRKSTAQKMKFYIQDSSVNVTKSAVSYWFAHIY